MKLGDRAEKMLREKLDQKLQHMLSRASAPARQQFLELALCSGAGTTSAITQLLEESCTPQEIYLALVYCRYAISIFINNLPEKDRAVLSKHLLIQHDKHATLLISAMEGRHEQQWKMLQAELQQEGHDHLLSRARNEWAQENEIYIYNLYHEMPVSTVVELLHVGEHSFTVARTKELISVIAASAQGDRAFAKLPKTELSVELLVEESTNKTVHLRYGEFRPMHSEKRRETRVQSSKPDPFRLKRADGGVLDGKLLDYSASGFGLSFHCETELQAGEEISFETQINDHKFIGTGSIVWVQNQPGYCRAGVLLEYSQELHLRLENEVRRREKSIMAELRLHGVPDSLTP